MEKEVYYIEIDNLLPFGLGFIMAMILNPLFIVISFFGIKIVRELK